MELKNIVNDSGTRIRKRREKNFYFQFLERKVKGGKKTVRRLYFQESKEGKSDTEKAYFIREASMCFFFLIQKFSICIKGGVW